MSNKLYIMPSGKFPMQNGKPVGINMLEYLKCCHLEERCLDIAYNEHRIAVGQGTVVCPTLQEMKDWLIGGRRPGHTRFIDHINGPFDEYGNLLMFTLSTWQEAAGIDITNWQPGDLEKGFAVLKWTGHGGFDSYMGSRKWVQTYADRWWDNGQWVDEDCDSIANRHCIDWNNTPWSEYSKWYSDGIYQVFARYVPESISGVERRNWKSERIRGYVSYELPGASLISCDIDFYGMIYDEPFGDLSQNDLDGIGGIPGEMLLLNSLSNVHTSMVIQEPYGTFNDCPAGIAKSFMCPNGVLGEARGMFIPISGVRAIEKWDFTNCTEE